jgi:hypothetical protein
MYFFPGTDIPCGMHHVPPMKNVCSPEAIKDTFNPVNLSEWISYNPKVGDAYFYKCAGSMVLFENTRFFVSVRIEWGPYWYNPASYPPNAGGDIDLSQMPDVIRRATGMYDLSSTPAQFAKIDQGSLWYCRAVELKVHNTIADLKLVIAEAEGWDNGDISAVTDTETGDEYDPHSQVFQIIVCKDTVQKQMFSVRF